MRNSGFSNQRYARPRTLREQRRNRVSGLDLRKFCDDLKAFGTQPWHILGVVQTERFANQVDLLVVGWVQVMKPNQQKHMLVFGSAVAQSHLQNIECLSLTIAVSSTCRLNLKSQQYRFGCFLPEQKKAWLVAQIKEFISLKP